MVDDVRIIIDTWFFWRFQHFQVDKYLGSLGSYALFPAISTSFNCIIIWKKTFRKTQAVTSRQRNSKDNPFADLAEKPI